jgi:hypothetical protein
LLKRLIVILITGTTVMLLAACSSIGSGSGNTVNGSGNVRSESRTLGDFNKVSLGSMGDVTIAKGDTNSLTVEADDNLLPLITTVVQNSELAINSKHNVNLRPSGRVRFIITVRDLQGVALGGSGNISASGLPGLRTVSLGGSGQIRVLDIVGGRLAVNIGGSGDVKLVGKTDSLEVVIGGSGTFRGGELLANTVTVTASGSGGALVMAESTLDVNISGSSWVSYIGSPIVSKVITGSGSVQKH